MQTSEAERAYLAGIIDGEGTIGGYWRHGTDHYLTPSLQVLNTRLELIEWLQRRWGGSIYSRVNCPSHKPGYRPAWTWTIAARKAIRAISEARPFLIIKAAQADIILALPAPAKGSAQTEPANIIAYQEAKARLTLLNKRGAHAA